MSPEITFHVKEEQWELTEDFVYHDLFILKGFRTDLASIPRVFWRLLAPFELSISAPLVHDFLYRNGGGYINILGEKKTLSRAETDRLFLKIMEEEGVSWWRRKAAYRAVRLFAGVYWRQQLWGDGIKNTA